MVIGWKRQLCKQLPSTLQRWGELGTEYQGADYRCRGPEGEEEGLQEEMAGISVKGIVVASWHLKVTDAWP
jgi:hypothetical protein